jgi:Fe-S-cluster-containing hydrogenase component 2
MACGLCRDACPTGVISGSQWTIAIESDGCTGCGLCAAVCPTGALSVEGFAPHAPKQAADRVVLECRRVARADRDPNAVVVPCLGGLTAPDLIDLVDDAQAPIVLSDHGWCAACSVGRCDAPWRDALDETKSLLTAVKTELGNQISAERKDLPVGSAEPVMQALRPDKQVGRRDFLQRFVRAATSADAAAESRRVVMGRGLVTALKRERILEKISALAASLDQDAPTTLMPAIKIADACDLNGLCAAICPTGALRRDETVGAVSLQFDATHCIACGECQRVCPSKALSLWPEGDGTTPQGATSLVARRTLACASCGNDFVPKGDESFCPLCQKSMDVMQEIASLRFRPSASS